MASPNLTKEQIINMILRGELPLETFIKTSEKAGSASDRPAHTPSREKRDGVETQSPSKQNVEKDRIVLGIAKTTFKTILDNGDVLGPLKPGDLAGLNRELYNRLRETGVVEGVDTYDRA